MRPDKRLKIMKSVECRQDSKLVLFGASAYGIKVLNELLESGFDRRGLAFCDNDANKHGKYLEEIEIISVEQLVQMGLETTIFISSMYFKEISKQLEEMGFTDINYDGDDENDCAVLFHALDLKLNEVLFSTNKVTLRQNERIRIVLLFQIASFWPSWHSFYESCKNDERVEIIIVLYEGEFLEKTQIKTAREYLIKNCIDYVNYNDFDIEVYKPHVLFLQTHYDEWHRPRYLWADKIKALGIRVAYIPYGIEFSNTAISKERQFLSNVINNAWRVYTISEEIKSDYVEYSMLTPSRIRVTGHPKFDALFCKEKFLLPQELLDKIDGRKVFLWKMHFPYVNPPWPTPSLRNYCEFAEQLQNFKEFFFIICPHPKFKDECGALSLEEGFRLMELLSLADNAFVYEEDDYRIPLLNSDYIMLDRSAIMIEAAAVGVPIMLIYNETCREPMVKGVEPLLNTYYSGSSCEDMIAFVKMCERNEDSQKEAREVAFGKCIPLFDGMCGERIKEDIVAALKLEQII